MSTTLSTNHTWRHTTCDALKFGNMYLSAEVKIVELQLTSKKKAFYKRIQCFCYKKNTGKQVTRISTLSLSGGGTTICHVEVGNVFTHIAGASFFRLKYNNMIPIFRLGNFSLTISLIESEYLSLKLLIQVI